MTTFGIFCPPAIGHLNPMCALGLEMRRRGHKVIFFGVPDTVAKIAHLDLTPFEIGAEEYPPGAIEKIYKKIGTLTGKAGLSYTINTLSEEMRMLFREAPEAIRSSGVDFLVIDQISSCVATVADYLSLPYVTICNAMLVHREPGVPPYSTHWTYSESPIARLRNQLGNYLIDFLTLDLWREVSLQRQRMSLPAYKQRSDAYSKLAQICQLPQEFDFPRECLPPHFHYIGRFENPDKCELIESHKYSFPFGELTERPLIYASLGTLQNRLPDIFSCIARACKEIDAQLVVSLGNPAAEVIDLPGRPIVVPFAPHQQLIERSSVVVTHAGMNTVLTSLGAGVPMVAIPITNEQPGIATRLQRTGAGKTIRLKDLNESILRKAISEVLKSPRYRNQARQMKAVMDAAGGTARAADIIEEAARTKRPVNALPD